MRWLIAIALLAASAWAAEPTAQGRVFIINKMRAGYVVRLEVDAQKQPRIKHDHYRVLTLEPGQHAFKLMNQKFSVEVEPGKDYYFRIDERALGWASPSITPLTPDAGELQIKYLKP